MIGTSLIEYLGEKKLNDLILANPYDSAGKIDVTKGPNRFIGLLGQEFTLSDKQALKQSNTTVGTLYGATYDLVRIQPDFGTVLLTDIVHGRPLFWNDTSKKYVTPLASATALFAGIYIGPTLTSANNKGDFIVIAVEGPVEILAKAALTKAAPAVNDPAVINVTANLATGDVLADATGWTNVQLALRIGRVMGAWVAGAAANKVYIDNAYRAPVNRSV